MSFCPIFVIGKKFDNATFAANFKIWKKIKTTFQISATNNGVKGEDFSADESPAEDGNPAVESEDNTENSKRADEVITLKVEPG